MAKGLSKILTCVGAMGKPLACQLILISFLSAYSFAAEGPDGEPQSSGAERAAGSEPPLAPENAPPSGVNPLVVPQRPVFSMPQMRTNRQERLEAGTAVLNFSEANLRDILRTITELTGVDFILAPGINARISVQTAKPIAKKDVFSVFESVLEVNGLSAVKTGAYYKIVPAQGARQRALELMTNRDPQAIPAGDRMINMVVPVDFIPANDLIQIVKPMLSPAGNITSFPKANTLIITDTASNLKGILGIVNTLDVDVFEKTEITLVPVKSVDVKTMHKELTEVFSVLGLGKDTPQFAIMPIERLNSLLVFSSAPLLTDYAKEWVEKLDKASNSEGASVHIYYVRNDKATNIKSVLDQLYSDKKGAPAAFASPGAQGVVQTNQAGAGAAGHAKYDGASDAPKIHIYEPSNALIIQASMADYQNMLNTIKELDRLPKQVLIDALIMEIKLDESTKYGIQWSLLTGNVNIQQNTGLVTSALTSPKGNISIPTGAAPSGLSILATDSSRFFGLVQALASRGKVDVLSNPHIMVKNYEKASINVGSDEPVATQSTQTAVTGTAGIVQNIEYRKTGVILTVTPQITEGGMVAMSIRQEVSDKSTDRTVGNAVYPSFTKREAETSIVARDRETLVIGGLIQEKNDNSHTGIPWLSDIPLLGSLFRLTTNTTSKTELVILLTPRVASDTEQAASAADAFQSRLDELKKSLEEKRKKEAPKP